MAFRRDGKTAHDKQQEWSVWQDSNADLITAAGLPPNVTRSRNDWQYFLGYGYHCDDYYGKFINNIEFSVDELDGSRRDALRQLLTAWELENTAVGHFFVGPPQSRVT